MPAPSAAAVAPRQRSNSQDTAIAQMSAADASRDRSNANTSRSSFTSPARSNFLSGSISADPSPSGSFSGLGKVNTSTASDRLAAAPVSPLARRHSAARYEASAKMKATLSAASSDKASAQRGADRSLVPSAAAPSPSQRRTSNSVPPSSSSAATTLVRRQSSTDVGKSRSPNHSSSLNADIISNHPIKSFRAENANLPAIPVQARASQAALAQQFAGSDATSAHSDAAYLAILLDGASATPMTSPSRSAPLPGSHGNTTSSAASASPNGRIRAQTAALANGAASHPSNYITNGSNVSYHGSLSMRTSPQIRALPQQPNMHIPHLQSLGASVMSSAPSSVYGGGANVGGTAGAASLSPGQVHAGPAWERHTAELTNCIVAFLSPILPTEEEYRIKEATRRQLERLANRVSPGAKLLAFGSMANGFALRNSDMDLCCLIGKDEDGKPVTQHSASELVEILGQLIREETDFTVMPLPKARIPIIKINRSPTADLPYDIACDIGFENRLALENTRLLLSYAMVDPQRLRTLVLFLKVWAKRRKLNSPYTGTLSSYGYTLLVLFFLTHVKKPAVLPNLQRVPPTRKTKPEEMEFNGNNIYFYDDVAALRKEWSSENHENVGELLIDFFRYFSKEFSYARDVISLKSETGLLSKDSKNWNAELCIEDPFQMGYNVSRTVTKDGLYTIRGEFMRASRMLTNMRGHKISALIAELCEEREDSLSRAPDGPGSMQRYPYSNNHLGMAAGGTSFYAAGANGARHYGNNRRYDGSNISGYGGSFAFEQMARGLSQGVAYPPTAAMLAPLSRTHGLSPKPQPPRFAATNANSADAGHKFSSAQSDSDGYAPEYSRASIGHASARTSPSFKHAVPYAPSTNGPGAQEAFAYGAEISFGAPAVASTRDDLGSTPRGKTSRSFSETLNRSKSLPRPGAMADGHRGPALAGAPVTANPSMSASLPPHASIAGAVPLPAPATFYTPGSPQALAPAELESRISMLSVQNPARRLSSSSHASSSVHFDSNSVSTLHCSSASSPFSLGHPAAQPDTHALVQEYLRRSAQLPGNADKAGLHVSEEGDETGSVISEATLDELARVSEMDTDTVESEWRAEDVGNQPPKSVSRLPDGILQHAKARKRAQQVAVAVEAASSGIARKDRENSAAAAAAAAASQAK